MTVSEWPTPDDPRWTGPYGVWVERCPKHKEIHPKETIADADARRAEKGLPPLDRDALLVFVTWAKLRPNYLDSTHRGRAVPYLVS